MIDQWGLVVEKGGDAGDSCNFTCCAIKLGLYDDKPVVLHNAIQYFWNGGHPVRHPYQKPWDNPKNFTRDQAVLLMQVLSPDQIKTFLLRNPRFFPNFERDAPGSAKVPWPHRHWKDSRPTPNNLPVWGEIQVPPNCELEFKWGDYADLITPDFKVMCLILAGEKPGWILHKVAIAAVHMSIEDHCTRAKDDRSHVDFKQLYYTAKAFKLHKEFAAYHPWGLYHAAEQYFTKRGMPEIAEAFFREFRREDIAE